MQQSNTNWTNNKVCFTRTHNGSPYSSLNDSSRMSTNFSAYRSHGPMTLGPHITRSSFYNPNDSFRPLMQHNRPPDSHMQTNRPLLRRPNFTDENTKSNSNESFVINFENLNEPSSSTIKYGTGAGVEPIYFDSTSVEAESSNAQNFPNNFQETSNNEASNNNNHNFNPNGNGSNINITNNNNITVPATQMIERTQENSNVGPTAEVRSIDKYIHKYFPLFTFLFIKAIYDHREGILIFAGSLVTFTHANSVVKREIAKQSNRSLLSLFILFVNLFICICFIYFVFQEQKLYNSLVFIPPYCQPLSIWDLLWMVGITDFILKFITIQIKAGMACFPAKILPYAARGKWYLMLECSSQLYRGLVPIQPWLYYLMEVYQGPEKVVGVFFSVAYMVSKGTELLAKIKVFLKALWKLLHNVNLGVKPTKEELETAGSQCPICHDEFNTPVLLLCRHVFCEDCVTTWFDREQTCPLCRAKIVDDPSWRDGATSFFAQLF